MPAEVKLVIVDDDLRDVEPIEAAASESGVRVGLVKARASQTETLELVIEELDHFLPIVLVDYRLDLPTEVHYRGGSLAADLKDREPGKPLVLLTSDANMHSLLALRPGSKSLFDWSVLKDDFSTSDDALHAVAQLVSIAEGFGRADVANPDDSVGEKLLRNLTGAVDKDLDGADLWFGREVRDRIPGEVARWILSRFLRVTSPLVSKAEAAAECGLTVDSFARLSELVDSFGPYDGVFSGVEERYWRSDLDRVLRDIADGDHTELVERARCTWCGEAVERSCSVCGLGCDAAHALPIAVQLGQWGLPAIACFRCVAEGRDGAGINDLDPDVADIVDLIVTGQLSTDL